MEVWQHRIMSKEVSQYSHLRMLIEKCCVATEIQTYNKRKKSPDGLVAIVTEHNNLSHCPRSWTFQFQCLVSLSRCVCFQFKHAGWLHCDIHVTEMLSPMDCSMNSGKKNRSILQCYSVELCHVLHSTWKNFSGTNVLILSGWLHLQGLRIFWEDIHTCYAVLSCRKTCWPFCCRQLPYKYTKMASADSHGSTQINLLHLFVIARKKILQIPLISPQTRPSTDWFWPRSLSCFCWCYCAHIFQIDQTPQINIALLRKLLKQNVARPGGLVRKWQLQGNESVHSQQVISGLVIMESGETIHKQIEGRS